MINRSDGSIETVRFDIVRFLVSDEAVTEFMADALETEDADYITHARRVIDWVRGATTIA